MAKTESHSGRVDVQELFRVTDEEIAELTMLGRPLEDLSRRELSAAVVYWYNRAQALEREIMKQLREQRETLDRALEAATDPPLPEE